jgi:DNA-binding PadR family transcriptional regulator
VRCSVTTDSTAASPTRMHFKHGIQVARLSSGSKSAATDKLEAEKELRAKLEAEQAKQMQALMHDHAKELAKLKDEKTREISRMKESHSAELDRLHGAMSQALSNTRAQLREKFASTSAADKVNLTAWPHETSYVIHTSETALTVPPCRCL